MSKDYYLILQVPPQAAEEEIKSAYRRRARELHPDVTGFESDPFLQLQEAYSVLSDPARRALYDRADEEVPVRQAAPAPRSQARRSGAAEPLRAVEPAGGFEDVSLLHSFDAFHPSFDEIFERWWSNFDFSARPKAEQLRSLTVDVPLSVAEAEAGGAVRILVPTRVRCNTCQGRGHVGPYECWRCEGHGALTGEYPVTLNYPAGLRRDYVVRLPLDEFGIHNFYLTVRFRPA